MLKSSRNATKRFPFGAREVAVACSLELMTILSLSAEVWAERPIYTELYWPN